MSDLFTLQMRLGEALYEVAKWSATAQRLQALLDQAAQDEARSVVGHLSQTAPGRKRRGAKAKAEVAA